MQPARLIVGLGNPGPDYAFTRHNIGFLALDMIVERYGLPAWKKKVKGLVTGPTDKTPALFLKPLTFMNLSGESVAEAMRFYKLNPSDVVVFHDDLALQPGKVKVKQGGGSGGHNGLKSIDAHIGPDYWRVRLGIGHPGARDIVSDYVLNPFIKSDQTWLEPLLEALAEDFDYVLNGKAVEYLSHVARKMCSLSVKDQET